MKRPAPVPARILLADLAGHRKLEGIGRDIRPAHAASMARESPGSGDDLSPDGRRAWNDRTVKDEDVALKKEQINRTEFANPEATWSYS
jgi:hypothetical protein